MHPCKLRWLLRVGYHPNRKLYRNDRIYKTAYSSLPNLFVRISVTQAGVEKGHLQKGNKIRRAGKAISP
jgi:hypothetical protein